MFIKSYEAQITTEQERYFVSLAGAASMPKFPAKLGAGAELSVNNRLMTLGTVAERFLKYDYDDSGAQEFFSERGQLDIGRYLFQQLFAGFKPEEHVGLSYERVDLQIITDDEQSLRLPWNLLYAGRNFLTAVGWSVSLAAPGAPRVDLDLPPSPKILIAIPEPDGYGPTFADQHVQKLEEILAAANRLHVQGKHLCVVRSWEEFTVQLDQFRPHIIYYYGHGEGDRENSRLIFEDQSKQTEEVEMIVFANRLRDLGAETPLIAYINCCYGDTGGLLGAGKQIGEVVPAVFTNNTVAVAADAQEQALEIWKRILLEGTAPHTALMEMQKHLAGQAGALRDIRWITPVLHRRYKSWHFNPSRAIRETVEPGWELTLDRREQASVVLYEIGSILQINQQKALAFLWFGCQGDGVEPFYKRIERDLENRLKDVRVYPVKIDFPPVFYEFQEDAGAKFAEAFDVGRFEEISDKIRTEARLRGGRQTIVYLQHPIINSKMELYDPAKLETYLKWINKQFVRLLGEHVFALIGLAYEIRDPVKFREAIEERVDPGEFDNISFQILSRLPRIERQHLRDFFLRHRILFTPEILNVVVKKILDKTGGEYEQVIEELRILREQGTRIFLEIGNEALENNGDALDF